MTDLDDGPAFARAVGPLIGSLGGGFMISSQAKAFAKDHGLRGREAYVLGRGSVLGDVDADVVTSAFGFWPADIIRPAWEGGRAVMPVATALPLYAEVSRDWGRARFDGYADAGRLAELLNTVVDGTDVEAVALFAGWRAVEVPADDEGRLAQLLHVLREHRGGLHLVAVVASGLTPHQAVLAGPGGPDNATFFGYEEPFEDVSHLAELRAAAEDLTDRLVAPAYDALGQEERADLVPLLQSAAAHAFRSR
jgi:hypothetical protein